MSHYTHLNEGQRYQISALMKRNNISLSEIARIIGCHRSTLYREIKRNQGKRGYKPKQAQAFAVNRKSSNQIKFTEFYWEYVKHLLTQYYSPEQIVGRLKHLGFKHVSSVEAIYRFIYRDKKSTVSFTVVYVHKSVTEKGTAQAVINEDNCLIVSIFHSAQYPLITGQVSVIGKVIS